MAWQDRHSTPMIQGSSAPVVENSAYTSTSSTVESTASKETSESETQSSSSTESSEKEMTMTKGESSQSDISISIKDATNPIKLELTGLDASCWVGILVDNAYVYQYTYKRAKSNRRHCQKMQPMQPLYLVQVKISRLRQTGKKLFR